MDYKCPLDVASACYLAGRVRPGPSVAVDRAKFDLVDSASPAFGPPVAEWRHGRSGDGGLN